MARQSVIQIVFDRLHKEEGDRYDPYDDATGKRVRAPVGHLTWGRGFNLEACGSEELFDLMERFLIGKIDEQLCKFDWYTGLDDARASVCLDIGYNAGVHGLLEFVHMISALAVGDWKVASDECRVRNEAVDKQRYAPFRQIILSGELT